jgi:hypothetical protein
VIIGGLDHSSTLRDRESLTEARISGLAVDDDEVGQLDAERERILPAFEGEAKEYRIST